MDSLRAHEILKQYWGFDEFRPLQQDIVNSIISGTDTVALLPTGGGKSICYQVPGMLLPGITLVISPLIALMKDQVDALNEKGIKAICINSAMKHREIDVALDNCVYGPIKFLYVSPERLKTELFIARLKKMKVALVAIDEAHCISQWGHDFRPPYMHIAEIRQYLPPSTPFVALTATATPETMDEIILKLELKKPAIFKKSFDRSNLAYLFLKDNDKHNRMLKAFAKVPGSGIVYARNRRLTVEISDLLKKNGISSDYYHAGLESEIRSQKQSNWIKNKTRVIACTNAFGMGIDKPDVRLVVHFQPPESIEAYFQEAGRAGRDGKTAYGALLFDDNDIRDLEYQLSTAFPERAEIKQVYQALVNYFQLATGSGKEDYLEFDLLDFSHRYNLNAVKTHKCLDLLSQNGYVYLTDQAFMPSRLMMKVNKEELHNFIVQSPKMEPILKVLLRSYIGLFDEFVSIREKELAPRCKLSLDKLVMGLKYLHTSNIINYIPQSSLPKMNFCNGVVKVDELFIDKETFEKRKAAIQKRNGAFIELLKNDSVCRSRYMLNYFGEDVKTNCGRCDVCLKNKQIPKLSRQLTEEEVGLVKSLENKALNMNDLSLNYSNPQLLKNMVRHLIDQEIIVQESNWIYLKKEDK